jgi:glycerate kinase
MRVLIAPDKFKGCLSAADVAAAMAEGVRDADPNMEIDLCPVADGGDGTADVLLAARGGRRVACRVTGPLPERHVDAWFVQLDDGSALVELAAASGLALLAPGDRDPLRTTTFGTGELVAAAVRAGARRVLLALGGSGTVDGGIGCVQACGFTILTTDGEPTSPTDPLCGRDLDRVLMVKHGRGEITNGIEVVAACDVTNPLCGPTGAARVFGPQKGASPAAVDWLDDQLSRLSRHHPDEAALPGAGAAGGMGFAVAAYFGGSLRSGFDLVADAVGLPERLRWPPRPACRASRWPARSRPGLTCPPASSPRRPSPTAERPSKSLIGTPASCCECGPRRSFGNGRLKPGDDGRGHDPNVPPAGGTDFR